MAGIASFGGKGAYIGKVRDDQLGTVFGHDLRAVGVQFRPGGPEAGVPTGRCIIVVTPDAQRTMNTYLGVSSLLQPSDIHEETVARGKVLYMEGYLYDRPAAKEAFRAAAAVAHANGRQVSLTLSDSFCVDRHRADFSALVSDEVDILFGNEDELLSLYEVDSFDAAVAAVRRDCQLAVITMGKDGCVIVSKDETVRAPAEPVEAAATQEKSDTEEKVNKTDTWDDQDYEYFFGDYLDDGYRPRAPQEVKELPPIENTLSRLYKRSR